MIAIGQTWVRKEPQGDSFDRVRVVGFIAPDEWSLAATDCFERETDERQVVAVAATPESLEKAFVFDAAPEPVAAPTLGENALGVWNLNAGR